MQDKAKGYKMSSLHLNQAIEILDSISDGFFSVNRGWQVIYINHRAASNLGLKPDECVGKNIWEAFPQIIGTAHETYYRKAMQEGQPQEFEMEGVLTDQWYNIRVYPSTDGISVYWQDITDRKRAEEALKESEEYFRAFFENSLDAIMLTSPDGNIYAANPAACLMFGMTEDELKQVGRNGIMDNSDPQIKEAIETRATHQQHRGEMIYRRKDGTRFPGESASAIFTDKQGLTKTAIIIRDITKRIKAAEAVRQSEEHFSKVFHSSPVALVISHIADGRIVDVNKSFELLFGFNRDELIGHRVTEIGIYADPLDRIEIVRILLENGEIHDKEVTFLNKTGSPIYTIFSSTIINSGGQDLMLSNLMDITERRIKNEEIRGLMETVQKEKDRISALVNSIPDEIWFVDINGRFTLANPSSVRYLGVEYTDGMRIEELAGMLKVFNIDGNLRPLKDAPPLRALKGETIRNLDEIIQNPVTKELRYRQVSAAPVIDASGNIIGSVSVLRDITERKLAEDALARAKEELEIKVKERTAELAEANEQLKHYGQRITQVQEEERKRIAYELHDDTAQYLSILKLQLDSLLQSGKIQSEEVIEKLRYLEKDADRAFQDVRRYSHELRPGVLEHLGLVAALEQIAEDTNRLKQIIVEVAVEGTEPRITEEVKLGFFRIAQEALNNARKHAKASKVNILLEYLDNRIRMSIKDNGIGFDIQEASIRSTLKGSLGLMSMQERAKLIGASLKIESKSGKGTTVRVELTR